MSVALADLDLPQLADVRRQLDDELTHLTNSFAHLKQAQARFNACIDNVNQVKNKGPFCTQFSTAT